MCVWYVMCFLNIATYVFSSIPFIIYGYDILQVLVLLLASLSVVQMKVVLEIHRIATVMSTASCLMTVAKT